MTSSSEDFLQFFTPPPEGFGYRQGVVTAWDANAGTNRVNVGGTDLVNLPVITQADLFNVRAGDTVAVVKYNDSYAVLGKIRSVGQGTLWSAIPLYPQFAPLTAAGTGSYAQVPAGTLVTWEGRIYATHYSFIQVDGIWGQASGANTSVFEVQVDGVTVGSWTQAGSLDVSNKGPYDISKFRDRQWIKAEVKITSSVGSGNVAIQLLACYLR